MGSSPGRISAESLRLYQHDSTIVLAMKRLLNILFYASSLLLVSTVIYWFVCFRHLGESFRLSDDLNHALGVLTRVRDAESHCYAVRGQFVPLEDLGPGRCGGLERSLTTGMDDGFSVEVHANPTSFSVKVHPVDSTRLHSLYMDQTGKIHFGTRDRPATVQSALLNPRE